jgi:thioredoxin-related protein
MPFILPASKSLPDDLALALRGGSPLVVMVSLDGCPFCKVARDSYLGPLQQEQGLPVVQLDMRSRLVLVDFKSKRLTHDELIRSWGIKVAPTVLFFGPGGVEVAERLVGGYIPDFYGAYLDERIRQSRSVIRAQPRPV